MSEEQKTLGWDDYLTERDEQDAPDIKTPIKGKYMATIEEVVREQFTANSGVEYDVIKMKLKACEDLEGDVSMNRFLDKTYFLGTSEWCEDPMNGYKQLCGNVFQLGLYQSWMRDVSFDEIDDAVAKISNHLNKRRIKVTAFPKKDKQQVRIYKQELESDESVLV